MEFALLLSALAYIVAIITLMVAIGFLITLLVGYASGNKTTLKVGKKGTLITGIALVISLVIAFGTGAIEDGIATQRNNRFDSYAKTYTKLYSKTSVEAEKIGNDVYDAWEDAIYDDSSTDNFDPSTVVSTAVLKDADTVYTLKNNMKKLKDTLDSMKGCNAPDRSIATYQKSYDKMNEMYEYVVSPYGNFNTFSNTSNSLDKEVGNYLRKLLNN